MVRQFILALTFLEVVGVEMVGREPRVVRQFILTITFLEVMGWKPVFVVISLKQLNFLCL